MVPLLDLQDLESLILKFMILGQVKGPERPGNAATRPILYILYFAQTSPSIPVFLYCVLQIYCIYSQKGVDRMFQCSRSSLSFVITITTIAMYLLAEKLLPLLSISYYLYFEKQAFTYSYPFIRHCYLLVMLQDFSYNSNISISSGQVRTFRELP